MARKFRFNEYGNRFRSLKGTLPRQIGIIALNHFKGSFRQEGFTDRSLDPWQARKQRDKGPRRAILVKSAALKKSLRLRSADFRRIRVGSYGIKYAARHNQGLDGMPQRQFIGPSEQMNDKIRRKIRRELKSLFK